jgi:DNA adenine methylase
VRLIVTILAAAGRYLNHRVRPNVNVVYGPHDLNVALAGFTVEEIQYSLRDVLNVGMDAEAYLDGKVVIDRSSTAVKGGSRLEFTKPAGRKAGSPPFLRYGGGKSKAAAQRAIMSKRPSRFREYREPFVGGGSLALRIDEYCDGPLSVWINDIDPDLIAVWLAVRDRPREFVEMCLSLPHYEKGEPENDRKNHQIRELSERATTDESMDAALRYFICNRVGWNGRVNYAMPSRMGCRNPLGWSANAIHMIERAAPFVRDWRITCGDYAEVITTPGDDVWGLLDAPYYKNTLVSPTSKLYRYNFTIAQHRQLAAVADTSEHKLTVCYDDHPEIRRLYPVSAGFHLYEEEWTYAGQSVKKKRKGKELIITNYLPPMAASPQSSTAGHILLPVLEMPIDPLPVVEMPPEPRNTGAEPALVNGNGKTGRGIWVWNLPAKVTCPGRSAICEELCYPTHDASRMEMWQQRYWANYRLSLTDTFIDWMVTQIRDNGIEILKWHASGDYYDAAYIRRVIEIVKKTPNTVHFAYTRSWDAAKRGHPELRPLLEELAALDNCYLLYSADAEMFPQDVPPFLKVAYLVRSDAENPADDVFVAFRDSHEKRKKEIKCRRRAGKSPVCRHEQHPVEEGVLCVECRRCFDFQKVGGNMSTNDNPLAIRGAEQLAPVPDESVGYGRMMEYAASSLSQSNQLTNEAACLARKSTVMTFRAGMALLRAEAMLPPGKTWGKALEEANIPRTTAWEATTLAKRAKSEEAVAALTPTEAKKKFGIYKGEERAAVAAKTKSPAGKGSPSGRKAPAAADRDHNPTMAEIKAAIEKLSVEEIEDLVRWGFQHLRDRVVTGCQEKVESFAKRISGRGRHD